MPESMSKREFFCLTIGFLLYILSFSTIRWLELASFISFVPLLFYGRKSNSKHWAFYLFITIFAANLINLLWLKATATKSQYLILAFLLSALQLIPFALYRIESKFSSLLFISSWIAIEYCLLHSELNFPMSLLGLSLASYPSIIQWWEFTGLLGGSLWILIINILVFEYFLFKKKVLC